MSKRFQKVRLGALPKLIVELGEGVVQWMVGGITRKLSILSLMILEESSKTKDFSPDMFRLFIINKGYNSLV